MRKTLLLLVACLTTVMGWAAKADPTPKTVTQSDGTQLTIVIHGDEDFHWCTTTDGVIVTRQGNDFVVAAIDAAGTLLPSTLLAHNAGQRSAEEERLAAAQHRTVFLATAEGQRQKAQTKRIGIGTGDIAFFPHTGAPKALVILVQFTDTTFTVADPQRTFNDYLNREGALPDYGLREDRNHSSVRQFFSDMSNGAFTPQFDIVGPYTLPQSSAYYGNGNDNATALIRDACTAADGDVDFSQYDANGDNQADLVYVIYAGYAESITGITEHIWPKSGTVNVGPFDGTYVRRYGINNELNYTPTRKFTAEPNKRINGIGLFCHEFSHTMGLPDLYPTVSSAQVDNQAMEYWDLMDGGTYTDNGYTPTPYTPWEKEVMGWLTLDTIKEAQQVTLADGDAVKVVNDDNHQYLILHNIQNTGWANTMMGHGLLVYRIDYPYSTVKATDNPNNTKGQPAVTIVPADGLLITSYRVYATKADSSAVKPYSSNEYYQSHYGDTYPGTDGVTELLSVDMNNYTLQKPLYNIQEANGTITFNFLQESFPTDGIVDVNGNGNGNVNGKEATYTLDGRRVDGNRGALKPGLYIRGGAKFLVR